MRIRTGYVYHAAVTASVRETVMDFAEGLVGMVVCMFRVRLGFTERQ